jgi:hypothetical protein
MLDRLINLADLTYCIHYASWKKWIPITPDDVKYDLYTMKEIGISILEAYNE